MEYQSQVNKNKDAASGRFAEAVSQIEVVKSFTQEKRELEFYQRNMDEAIKTTYPQSRYWHKHDIIRRLALNVIFFGVFAIIFTQAASGNLSPGQAVAVLLYAAQIRIPIFTVSYLVDRAQRAVSDSRDYFEVLSYPLEPTAKRKTGATRRFKDATIRFQGVGFAYADSKKQVLNDISFEVNQGKTLALVGKSGEGKSTLINLLMGLYEPTSGVIAVGKHSVKEISNHELRSNIAAVFQTPNLFSGTIFENISYAKPEADEATVIAAAKAANAHEFIKKLDGAYSAEIGERGVKLSGGQKQRISIARALLKDAPILILDEATSSLDATSEVAVQSALNRLMKGRTTIVIAHRLSTIQAVDEIVVIDGGTIAERGTPKELAKSGGIYTELLELQDSRSPRRQELLKKYELG
jgi:ATP-binding cassette subfamily B protein